jgi:hypothetical protein
MTNPLSEINISTFTAIETADRSKWDKQMYNYAGEEAVKLKYYSQWILGQLADEYSHKHGDCSEFARAIRVEPNSLLTYRWVYRRLIKDNPKYVPDGALTWTALQIISRYNNPTKLIEEYSGKGMITADEIVRDMKNKSREEVGQKPVPKKPRVIVSWNDEESLWEMKMSVDDMGKINWKGEFGKAMYEYLKKIWHE